MDEPSPANALNLPINCAKDDTSVNWPWKYLTNPTVGSLSYEDGLVDVSESFGPASGGVTGGRLARWRYQAVGDVDIDLDYNLTASTTGGFFDSSSVSISIDVNGVEEFSDSDSDSDDTGTGDPTSASISGIAPISLPASVVPSIVVITASVEAFSLLDGEADLNYSIS